MGTITSGERTNLPANLTDFVGRRTELAEAKQALSRARMVTLIGVGGVGKSRLALQTAESVKRSFSDGAWLVELASLSDPALLPQTVLATLNIKDQSTRAPADILVDYLSDKHLLLVLDNCEHLADACAHLAHRLLSQCARLRILATSRQPLGIGGECTPQVPPLSLPRGDQAPSVATLLKSDAIQLFVARAQAIDPGFGLTADNAETVAHVCQRLDGIALAIELAAAQLRYLSLHEIGQRINDRYRLLTGGSRVALPRQRTLRALIDWSFDLCSPTERALWARLSIFSGSFELEAAEEVCSDDTVPRDTVLEALTGLIDKSIIIRDDQGPRSRFRLLECIRVYGAEYLAESAEYAALRRRHRNWYLRLVEQAEHAWFGPRQTEWFARMRLDHPNIRAALEYCLNMPGETEPGLRIAGALRAYWHSTGAMREGRHWIDQALRQDTGHTTARAKALWCDSWLAVLQDDLDTAKSRIRDSQELAEKLGDEVLSAQVMLASAVVALHSQQYPDAITRFREAATLHRRAGALSGLAIALYLLALTSTIVGDLDTAITVGEECQELCDRHDERWYHSHALWVLGIAVWQQGDIRRAVTLERDSLRLKPSLYDRLGISHCIEALAWFAATSGESERATRLLGAAQAVRRTIGVAFFGFAHLVTYRQDAEKRLRHALGDDCFEHIYGEGLSLTVDQAVAFALGEKATPAQRGTTIPELTRRETEVAELIAAGCSNKAIADKLVVSQRTAESHVENILIKLGFTTRAQVAAWFVERLPDRNTARTDQGAQSR